MWSFENRDLLQLDVALLWVLNPVDVVESNTALYLKPALFILNGIYW